MTTTPEGRLIAVEEASATLPLIFSQGSLFDATGRLVVSTTAPVAHFRAGVGYSATGAVCIALEP